LEVIFLNVYIWAIGNEVKTLVVDDKWMQAIEKAVKN
jgi:hypothetical protein